MAIRCRVGLCAFCIVFLGSCGGDDGRTLAGDGFPAIDIAAVLGGRTRVLETGALVDGYQVDIAFLAGRWYLLVQAETASNDALYALDAANGTVLEKFTYPARAAIGLAADGNDLWLLSRNNAAFLRRIAADGTVLETVSVASRPPGSAYGLALLDGRFYFSSTDAGVSRVHAFDRGSGVFETVREFPEKVYALHAHEGRLLAARSGTDPVFRFRLTEFGPDGSGTVEYNFFKDLTWGLAGRDGLPWRLVRGPGGRAQLSPFALLAERRMAVGNPRQGTASLTYVHGSTNGHPYRIDAWLPDLRERADFSDLQNVSAFAFSATPDACVRDAFGNGWARHTRENMSGSLSNTFSFRLLTADVAWLPDATADWTRADFPAALHDRYTAATYCFDHDHPLVAAAAAAIPAGGSYLERVMAVRGHVNAALTVTGPSAAASRASDFLASGEGRCYAHSLCFAAIARRLGIPTRVVGGILVASNGNILSDDPPVHTWNQVYFPDCGWVDFDTVNDDTDGGGADPLRYVARSGHREFFLNFAGSFAKRDFTDVFVERSWISVYRYTSLDRDNPAEVRLRALSVCWQND